MYVHCTSNAFLRKNSTIVYKLKTFQKMVQRNFNSKDSDIQINCKVEFNSTLVLRFIMVFFACLCQF